DHIPTETSRDPLGITQKFVRKDALGGGHCLFSCLRNVLGIADKITIKDLRKKAADFNRQPGKIDKDWLLNTTGKTVEQYCDEMENTTAWGGEPEIRAIAELYKIIIRVVNVNSEKFCVSASEFPPNQTSFDRCCYIILNNNHYESLHLRTDNNSNDERSIFDSNDEEIKKLIPSEQFVEPTNLITMTGTKSLSKKRKRGENDDDLSMGETTDILASSILKKNNVSHTTPIEQYQLGDATNSHNKQNQQQIRFQTEPTQKFRARYLTQYIPKNTYKRDGKTKSKQSSPTYFPDRNNKHCLTLLIPSMLVFGENPVDLHRIKVEICIVTVPIDECIYIHPYFKFYKPKKDGTYSLFNPMSLCLGYDEDGKANTMKYEKVDTMKKKFHLNDLCFATTLYIKNAGDEEYHPRLKIQYISEKSTKIAKNSKIKGNNTG
ncbi:unnamed protein product, partial [Rotaria sp. Silwood1]